MLFPYTHKPFSQSDDEDPAESEHFTKKFKNKLHFAFTLICYFCHNFDKKNGLYPFVTRNLL